MWSEIWVGTEEEKNEQLTAMHSRDDEAVKHLEKAATEGTIFDIRGLYHGCSIEQIKRNILQLLFGDGWMSYETNRVSSLFESFSLRQPASRDMDEEENNDQYEPWNVYPSPEKTLSARRRRQRLTNSEKHYILRW